MQEVKTVKIEYLSTEKEKNWDEYVYISPDGTFFHLSGWMKVLKTTFGYKPYYLYAENDGRICGVLPLYIMRNLNMKKVVSSIPIGVYGGVCADDETTAFALLEIAKEIVHKEQAQYLELKNISFLNGPFVTKDLYYRFIEELPGEKERCLENQPRKARAASRKAISLGLEAEVATNNQALRQCHHIYATSVRNLGSPVVPYKLFSNIMKEFPHNTIVFSVKLKDKIIASVLTFLFRDTVMPHFGGALPEYIKYQPSNFMYLKLMEYGVEKGFRYFDYGRSKKDSGSFKFKEHQGFRPTPLFYQYYLYKAKEMPNYSPANAKYSLPIKIWKHMPLWFTKMVGPRIVKYIGG